MDFLRDSPAFGKNKITHGIWMSLLVNMGQCGWLPKVSYARLLLENAVAASFTVQLQQHYDYPPNLFQLNTFKSLKLVYMFLLYLYLFIYFRFSFHRVLPNPTFCFKVSTILFVSFLFVSLLTSAYEHHLYLTRPRFHEEKMDLKRD